MAHNKVVTSPDWAWRITKDEQQQSLNLLNELKKAPAEEQRAIFDSDASWIFDEE